MTDITIVIVSYNTAEMTARCLRRVEKSEGNFEKKIIIVDNASKDGTAEKIAREFPEVQVIANAANVGFGRANNQALTGDESRYVLLLNSDAFIPSDAVVKSIAFMDAHPKCGISGVRVVGENGQLEPSARYRPTPCNSFLKRLGLERLVPWVRPVDDMSWDHRSIRECDWVPGCYFMIRRKLIDQVGLFDPRYFLYYEEVDLCMAAQRAGWSILFEPDVEVMHIGGASARNMGEVNAAGRQLEGIRLESEFLFYRKNYGLAGVLVGLCLSNLADIVIILKNALKLRKDFPYSAQFRHIRQIWRTFTATGAGTRPTR